MASKRSKKSLVVEKQRILTRLKEIEEDKEHVVQHMNNIFKEAQAAAESIINETSKSKFLMKHHAVTQTLNDCWREVFRVKSHLLDNKDDNDESSTSSEESIDSLMSEFSTSSRMVEKSRLSTANSFVTSISEESLAEEKLKVKYKLQAEGTNSKNVQACKPTIIGESGCAGDTYLAQESAPVMEHNLPSSPCGDGLENDPLINNTNQSPLSSTFPNVNCMEFVAGLHSFTPGVNEKCSPSVCSNVALDEVNSNTVSDSVIDDVNSWAAWQSQTLQSASKLELDSPESHSDGDESLNNSVPSERSLPSDRTIIGAPVTVAANLNPISLNDFVSDVTANERTPSIVPDDIHSHSTSAITMSDCEPASVKAVLSPPVIPLPVPVVTSTMNASKRLISYGSSADSTCSSSSIDTGNKLCSLTASAESLTSGSNDICIENLVLQEGSCVEGIVTELTSPTAVWIQIQDEHSGGLLEELSAFCSGSKSEGVGKELTEGHFCCAKCTLDDSWHRAVVQKIRYKPVCEINASGAPKFVVDSVDVRYVDYGNSETLGLDRLKRLCPKFVKLRAQAFCCLLAKLRPYSSDFKEWKLEMTTLLKDLVFGKEVSAVILKYCPNAASTVQLSIPDEAVEDVEDLLLKRLAENGPALNKETQHQAVIREPTCIVSSTNQPDDCEIVAKGAAKRMKDASNSSPVNDKADEILRENFTWSGKIEKLVPEAPDGFFLMISHINSPSSFYSHILPDSSCYDALQKDLNDVYEKATDLKAPIASVVATNTCWGTRYSDGCWYRVRVLVENKKFQEENPSRRRRRIAINSNEDHVYVEYVDYGNQDWVSIENLRPLLKEHCKQPGLAVHMRLAHIFPLNMTPEQGRMPPRNWHWSEDSTSMFKEMAESDETLLARFIEDEEELDHFGVNTRLDNDPLNLLLWNGPNYTTNKIINKEMVNGGFAMSLKYGPETSGPSEASKDSRLSGDPMDSTNDSEIVAPIESSEPGNSNGIESVTNPKYSEPIEELQNWDPMKNDFTSPRNSYEVDTEDAGVATIGYKYQDESRVCRFYSRGDTCRKGSTCPYKHINTADCIMTTDTEPTYATTQEFPLPLVDTFVAAEVTAIFNPGHFYVILPFGNRDVAKLKQQGTVKRKSSEDLSTLMEALQNYYSRNTCKPNPNIDSAIGEVVAARFSSDNKWYRAKVVDVISEENQVMVFFVDFGNTDWVFQRDIQALEPQFIHLPHQAIECFMSNIEPVRRSERLSWSVASRDWFEEMVDGKLLVLHVLSSDQTVLYVELHDTNDGEDIVINSQLVERGYAQWSKAVTIDNTQFRMQLKKYQESNCIKIPG